MRSSRYQVRAAVLLLLATLVASASNSTAPAASAEQENALLLLRGAIDHNGILTSAWDPASNACSWKYITCGATGAVTGIDVQGLGLTGQLPLDSNLWSALDTLTNINMANNKISGYLPPQLSAATGLQYVSFHGNQLASPLPTSWSALTNLQGLDLGSNQLYGNLPTDWSQLSALRALDLSANQLSGTVPASYSTLPNLQAASFAGNAGLCNASSSPVKTPLVYYGPCNTSSPLLPNINPTYSPAPAPFPAPAPIITPPPAPRPAASPSPLPSPSPSVAPPPTRPTTYTQMSFQVMGTDQATFEKNLVAYKVVIGNAGQVDPSYVDVTASVVATSPAPAPAGRRLLAASPAPVTTANSGALLLSNTLYTSSPSTTQANLQTAVADGSLARQLSALGMTLDTTSIVYPSAAPSSSPPPSNNSSGGGTNVGAIVGGVVGGVVGAAVLALLAIFVVRRRGRSSSGSPDLPTVVTGTKRGGAMYTANPAFDASAAAAAPAAPVIPPFKKPLTKTIDNTMFTTENPLETPRQSTGRVGASGQNPLYDSQLSDPGRSGYAQSDVSGAQTARSRQESARGAGPISNPVFAVGMNPIDDDDDDFADANPIFQSARSGTDIMATAESDLPLESSRTYDTATGSAKTNSARGQQAVTNPMFGANPEDDGQNPIFDKKGKSTK